MCGGAFCPGPFSLQVFALDQITTTHWVACNALRYPANIGIELELIISYSEDLLTSQS